jgi:hypothetical protein
MVRRNQATFLARRCGFLERERDDDYEALLLGV